jgi:hypothetical protein
MRKPVDARTSDLRQGLNAATTALLVRQIERLERQGLAGHGLLSGQPINLLTELTLGTHTFAVHAADNLQNAGNSSVTFTIIVTPDSIKDDVHNFRAGGAIKNDGLANSLLAKLNAAAGARAREIVPPPPTYTRRLSTNSKRRAAKLLMPLQPPL